MSDFSRDGKIIELGGFGSGWGPDYSLVHGRTWDKIASTCHVPSAITEVAAKLKPRPEGLYVHLNALGSYEYWGPNSNADAFPEWSLLGKAPPADVGRIITDWNADSKRFQASHSPGTYGMETFKTHAHVYIQHANKDPLQSKGDVVAAAYNDFMHRGELIVFVYKDRDPEGYRQLAAGDPVAWSMGARLPYDVCSRCLNFARNRTEYCDHMKLAPRTVLDDGNANFTYNFFPVFFDISRVKVGADRSAFTLRKVASAVPAQAPMTRSFADPTVKTAWYAKRATVVKNTPQEVGDPLGHSAIDPKSMRLLQSLAMSDIAYGQSSEIDPQLQSALRKPCGLHDVLGAYALAGIVVRPDELRTMREISGQPLPKKLEFNSRVSRLLPVTGRRAAARSMRAVHLRKRKSSIRKTAGVHDQPEAAFVPDEGYRCYLRLLYKEAQSIIKTAAEPEVRLALDPYAVGRLIFSATAGDSDTDWLPFVAAAVTGC